MSEKEFRRTSFKSGDFITIGRYKKKHLLYGVDFEHCLLTVFEDRDDGQYTRNYHCTGCRLVKENEKS